MVVLKIVLRPTLRAGGGETHIQTLVDRYHRPLDVYNRFPLICDLHGMCEYVPRDRHEKTSGSSANKQTERLAVRRSSLNIIMIIKHFSVQRGGEREDQPTS